jgi:DNA-nicking Smr family endonuclease
MTRRRLSDDERALWQGVTRSIAPLRDARRRKRAETEPAAATAPKPSPPAKQAKPKSNPSPGPKPAGPAAPRATPSPPPPAPLGRRVRQRIARGTLAIDGRLDLHGMTQAEAHAALLGFLRRSQAAGARIVLVITGKGSGRDGERGVLKRQVPQWLRLPEFRGLIVGTEPAGIGHGGEGALYVSLRKAR